MPDTCRIYRHVPFTVFCNRTPCDELVVDYTQGMLVRFGADRLRNSWLSLAETFDSNTSDCVDALKGWCQPCLPPMWM